MGGNGQNVTFRLAARYAEELNLVFLDPDEVGEHMAVARQRCEEEGRDPATLRISLYCRDGDVRPVGQERVDRLGAFAALGLDRFVAFPSRWDTSEDGLARFAEDCRAAGCRWPREWPSPSADGWRPVHAGHHGGGTCTIRCPPPHHRRITPPGRTAGDGRRDSVPRSRLLPGPAVCSIAARSRSR